MLVGIFVASMLRITLPLTLLNRSWLNQSKTGFPLINNPPIHQTSTQSKDFWRLMKMRIRAYSHFPGTRGGMKAAV